MSRKQLEELTIATETDKRLPSFNDFSPEILHGDLRLCLQAIVDGNGDDKKVIDAWAKRFFGGKDNKRSQTNIPATLRSTGLSTGTRPLNLSNVGREVLAAPSPQIAAEIFCGHLIREKNGNVLLEALASLRQRGGRITKPRLQEELTRLGIKGLSNNTTDHTTLKNWMVHARIVDGDGKSDDALVRKILGLTVAEADELKSLPLAQQVFLQYLRREHLSQTGPFPSSNLLKQCQAQFPDLFDPAQFAKKVRQPLQDGGWLEASGLASGPQGGKSGLVIGTAKLLAIPIERFVPDFDANVPPELRSKLQTPASEIRADLFGSDKYKGGLALELLALRMVLDLGLDPRHFRLRSAQSAHAEVDLIAEGAHLMFSRWAIQCKRYAPGTNVQLADVAKEMGIAIFSKAHVVVMITTSDFTSSARAYADEVTQSQPVQFLFITGDVVNDYLEKGKDVLLEHVRENARSVMSLKRKQPLPQKEE